MKYSVGQKVKIKSLAWYNENSDDKYNVVLAGGWYFSKPMSILCGKELIIDKISHVTNPPYYIMTDNTFAWTDEMIEGLVEEETKSEPKFKVGDKVKWFNHTCNITFIGTDENTYIYLIKHDDYREDKTFVKWVPESELTFEDDEETKPMTYEDAVEIIETMQGIGDSWECPQGYQFVDENGNVINATKIVLEKKKKEYPQTYEECCEIMNVIMETEIVADAYSERLDDYELNLDIKIENLRKLLICRDAYWKIAGEEMGLGKPWEPDYDGTFEDGTPIKYVIYNNGTRIVKERKSSPNHILAFPTEEMRDAFYENFDPDIEICKEFL